MNERIRFAVKTRACARLLAPRGTQIRKLRLEPLEKRLLLSVDLVVAGLGFYSDQEPRDAETMFHLKVDYRILGEQSAAFDIGVYRSVDGITIPPDDPPLTTYEVSDPNYLIPGKVHTVSIPAKFKFDEVFQDVEEDYYLIAKLDCYEEIEEAHEDNNESLFEGGVFLATEEVGGQQWQVLQVHGYDVEDPEDPEDSQRDHVRLKPANAHVFYDNSAFDGYIPGPNHDPEGDSDDKAIATDKEALMYDQTPTFVNVSSYEKGLNGIMVDLWDVPAITEIDLGDFQFQKQDVGTQWEWEEFDVTPEFDVRQLAADPRVTRVTMTWEEGAALEDGWLRVMVDGGQDSDTGLEHDGWFCFGSLVGEVDGVKPEDLLGSQQPAVRCLQAPSVKNIGQIAHGVNRVFTRSGYQRFVLGV